MMESAGARRHLETMKCLVLGNFRNETALLMLAGL